MEQVEHVRVAVELRHGHGLVKVSNVQGWQGHGLLRWSQRGEGKLIDMVGKARDQWWQGAWLRVTRGMAWVGIGHFGQGHYLGRAWQGQGLQWVSKLGQKHCCQ